MNSDLFNDNALFKECVEVLNAQVLNYEEDANISKAFKSLFPITTWGKIDWAKINRKIEVGYDHALIISSLAELLEHNDFDKGVYILWSDGGIPAIKTNLEEVMKHFYDVASVSFEAFIFNVVIGYIIEIRSNDLVTVGVIDKARMAKINELSTEKLLK